MASGNSSLDNLTNLYKHVIDDVVRNMREEYLNESMDTELLEELKQLWLSKLSLSGAVSRPAKADPPPRLSKEKATHKPSGLLHGSSSASTSSFSQATPLSFPPPPPLTSVVSSPETVIHHAPPRVTPTSSPAIPALLSSNSPSLVLHQNMLAAMSPSSSVSPSTNPSSLIITSPMGQATPITASTASKSGVEANLAGITPAINPFSTMGLGMVNAASQQLAQSMVPVQGLGMVNAASQQLAQSMVPVQTPQGTVLVSLQNFMALHSLKQQQQQQATPTAPPSRATSEKDKEVVQLDGTAPLVGGASGTTDDTDNNGVELDSVTALFQPSAVADSRTWFQKGAIAQLDGADGGPGDTSSDENSDLDEDSSEDEAGPQQEVLHDSPLNSDDDIDDDQDDGGAELDFETKDNIVCQWEKVYRVKRKWKFQLKDGIMHLDGHDYVFHKVAGEADW